MTSFEVLFDDSQRKDGTRMLDAPFVRELYGTPLYLPESTPAALVASLITTIDGITTFDANMPGGSVTIRNDSRADRVLLGLLRSAADIVLIGAGTLRAYPRHVWTAGRLLPSLEKELADARFDAVGTSISAPLVVVSGSGNIPLEHPVFSTPDAPVVVATTMAGRVSLMERGYSGDDILVAPGEAHTIEINALLAAIAERFAPRLILCEGGPALLGQLLTANSITDLFHTVSPIVAGSPGSTTNRRGMFGDFSALPDTAPHPKLLSVRRAENHLFLRYRF